MGNDKSINIKSLLITIIVMLVLVTAGTYAWLKYRTNDSALVLTVGEMDGMSVTLKPYQIKTSLSPVSTYTNGVIIDVTVQNKKAVADSFELYYFINMIDNALIDSGFKYTITKSTNNGSSYSIVENGNFVGANNNSNMTIYEENVPANVTYLYKVYLWIDASAGNQSGMQNKTFNGELRADVSKIKVSLYEGLIPVKIADDGTVTTTSEKSGNWFNYSNREWANAVLVKNSGVKTREENATPGTVIDTSDILAYYVWIPRFSYKLWTINTSDIGNEQEIDIKFVDVSTKDVGTAIGSYRTPPAFTFGGEELSGIWVGKFETSHETLSATASGSNRNNLACSNELCTNADGLRAIPNVDSIKYNNIANQFYAIRSMERNGNAFGINNIDVNSHMLKNSEWGAVAYLSHSKYGINKEIRINNYSSNSDWNGVFKTGCGAGSDNASVKSTCDIPYGSATHYPQSTTGNISGIFDMVGGSWEYAFGNYNNLPGEYSGFTTMPDGKYYDAYEASIFDGDYKTNVNKCTFSTCYGHALNETNKWYGDNYVFVNTTNYFFARGGYVGSEAEAGIFGYYSCSGDAEPVVARLALS